MSTKDEHPDKNNEGWSGMKRFLSDETGAWINFVSNETLECVEAHQEAVQRNKELQMLYMDNYQEENFDVVNPDVKYNHNQYGGIE